MGVRMNYVKVTKRIAAYLVDQTTFLVCCSFFPRLNYVCAGITRRAIAHIIDGFTIMGTSLVCLIFVGVIFHIAGF